MDDSILITLIEISVALLWIGVLLFIFSPRFVPDEKKQAYRSRKLRFALVVFAIVTGFYSVGKVDSFGMYKDFVIMILLIISGANVADKFVQNRSKSTEEKT